MNANLLSCFQQQQWMPNMPSPGIGQGSPLRPPMGGVQQRGSLYRPDVKGGFPMPPHGMKVEHLSYIVIHWRRTFFVFVIWKLGFLIELDFLLILSVPIF
jgi:hypothetical protein